MTKPKPPEAKAVMGRPTIFSSDMADAICVKLCEGLSLREICRAEGMPGPTTVYRWLQERQDFREQYRAAREASADHFLDEMLEIADDAKNDWMERNDKEGNAVGFSLNGEHIQRSRQRIETRMWIMAKLAPKKYGDKLQLSNDPDAPFGDKHLTVIEVKGQLLEGLGLKKVTDGTGG